MANIEKAKAAYLRNFVFGVEDSLVSTVGLISGVAAAGVDRSIVAVTGLVLIFVEAFSMALGSFLADTSALEYTTHATKSRRRTFISAGIMFSSYFISGFIPLSPYLIIHDAPFWWAIALSLAALLTLGFVSAKISHVPTWRSGLRMLLVGGIAITVGVGVGKYLRM